MDPLHFTAARPIFQDHDTAPDQIDAFYRDNALEGLHALRRILNGAVQRLRADSASARNRATVMGEFAQTAGSA